MTTIKQRNREYLIQNLQEAADRKGSTPTSLEADKRRFGLHPKRTYLVEFGSWNKAVEAAGLQSRPWKGRRGADPAIAEDGRKATGPVLGGFNSMRSFIDSRIAEERAEIEVLEQARDILLRRAG